MFLVCFFFLKISSPFAADQTKWNMKTSWARQNPCELKCFAFFTAHFHWDAKASNNNNETESVSSNSVSKICHLNVYYWWLYSNGTSDSFSSLSESSFFFSFLFRQTQNCRSHIIKALIYATDRRATRKKKRRRRT